MGKRSWFRVGADENAFNGKVTKYLKSRGDCGEKIPGTLYNPGLPDIIGGLLGRPIYLENKLAVFVTPTTRESTIIAGEGCSNKRKKWTTKQKLTLRGFEKTVGKISSVGGLIAVRGYDKYLDLVIGVDMDFIRSGSLSAMDVRYIWEQWPYDQFFLLQSDRRVKDFEVYASLAGLIESIGDCSKAIRG